MRKWSACSGRQQCRDRLRTNARRSSKRQRLVFGRQSPIDQSALTLGIKSKLERDRRESAKRIVLPNRQPEFRTGREQPVGFVYAASNKVIRQDADVRSMAAKQDGIAAG